MKKLFVIIVLFSLGLDEAFPQGEKPSSGLPFFRRVGESATQDGPAQCQDILEYMLDPVGFSVKLSDGSVANGFKPVLAELYFPGIDYRDFTKEEILFIHEKYLEIYAGIWDVEEGEVVEIFAKSVAKPVFWNQGDVLVGFLSVREENSSKIIFSGKAASRPNYFGEWGRFYKEKGLSGNCGNPLFPKEKEGESISRPVPPRTEDLAKKDDKIKTFVFPETETKGGVVVNVMNYNMNSNTPNGGGGYVYPEDNRSVHPERRVIYYEEEPEDYYQEEYIPTSSRSVYHQEDSNPQNQLIMASHAREQALAGYYTAQSRRGGVYYPPQSSHSQVRQVRYREQPAVQYASGCNHSSGLNYSCGNSHQQTPQYVYQQNQRPVLDAFGRVLGFAVRETARGAFGELGGKTTRHLFPNFGNQRVEIVGNNNWQPVGGGNDGFPLGPIDPWTPIGGGDDGFFTGGANDGFGLD